MILVVLRFIGYPKILVYILIIYSIFGGL